jgi:hypothetical protein
VAAGDRGFEEATVERVLEALRDEPTAVGSGLDAAVELALPVTGCPGDVDVHAAVSTTMHIVTTGTAPVRADRTNDRTEVRRKKYPSLNVIAARAPAAVPIAKVATTAAQ